MPTENQINANRLNAQKSTGPKTPEGKAKVSQNAVTHGLTSKRPVLDIEDTEEFRQFTTELLNCLAPADPLEFFFAQRATCLAWRVQRAQSYETLILNNLIQSVNIEARSVSDGIDPSLPVHPNTDGNSLLGQVLLDDFRTHRTLEKISRYEARLESSMLRCFKKFEKLRQNRITNSHTYNQSVKTNPINVGQASPLDIKYDKTNPNRVDQASSLRIDCDQTKPNCNPIRTQDSINLHKIPA